MPAPPGLTSRKCLATGLAADPLHRWRERSTPPALLFPIELQPRPDPKPPGIMHPMGKGYYLFMVFDWPIGELLKSLNPASLPLAQANCLKLE